MAQGHAAIYSPAIEVGEMLDKEIGRGTWEKSLQVC
jgi:hypothetical protein